MNNTDKKQIYNPYLPSYEYIPDGEPRVFGDRLYIYGNHDRFGGSFFVKMIMYAGRHHCRIYLTGNTKV